MMQETRVVVFKNGVPKELHNLSEEVILKLEKAYMEEPVRGISQELFEQMSELLSSRVAEYRCLLEKEDNELFAKSIAFAKAFDICSENDAVLFDCLLWIDRMIQERSDFTSRDITLKEVKGWTKLSHNNLYREFKSWSRDLFKFHGIKGVAMVKFLKFFFEVATVA